MDNPIKPGDQNLYIKDVIFISHAAPEDNEFSRWLSLQLIGLGYNIWCDVVKLKGGEDFWVEIEAAIRNSTIKFLYVLSKNSNQREGTLKELAVSQKVKKQLDPKDDHFIIPLHLDSSLSYDEINIDLVRLNSIDFKQSWHKGLTQLLDKLKEDCVPKPHTDNFDLAKKVFQELRPNKRELVYKEELYSSNWFQVLGIPEKLYFHKFADLLPYNFPMWKCRYPARQYKDYFATFAGCFDFIDELPKTQQYHTKDSIEITTKEIIEGTYDTQFLDARNAKNIFIFLLNMAFQKYFKSVGLRVYKLASKRIAFWFPIGTLEKEKINHILMVGKMKYGKDKRINWHFAVSASAKLDQDLLFVVKSHIVFTWDGAKLIELDSIQHRGRRKQGKGWWNKHWEEKLLNFMDFFSNDNKLINMAVGSNESIAVSVLPVIFKSPVGYSEPSDDNLPEDNDMDIADSDDELLESENDEDQ